MRPPRLAATLPRYGAVLVALGVAVLHTLAPVYAFSNPVSFQGARLFNPYSRLTGTWQTTNLHVHGYAWGGVTAGGETAAEIHQQYRAMGYGVVAVSDYQHISDTDPDDPTAIPVYEHGYNAAKTHQLAIGAKDVEWEDFPLWQTRNHKQYVLDRLKESAELVAITHPELRGGYSIDDLRYLTNYDLLEVVSHFGVATEEWDAALSSGHAVWAIGGDDSHNAGDRRQTGTTWLMVDGPSTRRADVISALRDGRVYVTVGTSGRSDALLRGIQVRGDTVVIRCTSPALWIELIGQDGRLRKVTYNSSVSSYVFDPADTYIRAVVRTPHTTMYFNPVFRYDGQQIPRPMTPVDTRRTRMIRGAMLDSFLALAWLLLSVPTPRWRRVRSAVAAGIVMLLVVGAWSGRERAPRSAAGPTPVPAGHSDSRR